MEEIEALWKEVRELSLGESGRVERLEFPPTPLHFLRDYVNQNKPCIISNATLHWPALSSWTDDSYLTEALSSADISVHLTPHGQADALVPLDGSLCFASAHVQRMPFPKALSLITNNESQSKLVAYAQQQNNCFPSEYSALAGDCDPHIPWASEALGCLPDAVNMWIGNHLSTTSFHKDHYENLYAVVTGQKHFLLLPPTDVHRMYIRDYPSAQYSYSHDTGEFTLELEKPDRYVPWCSVDPYPSPEDRDKQLSSFPLYFDGPKPFHCTVNPGEILYLFRRGAVLLERISCEICSTTPRGSQWNCCMMLPPQGKLGVAVDTSERKAFRALVFCNCYATWLLLSQYIFDKFIRAAAYGYVEHFATQC